MCIRLWPAIWNSRPVFPNALKITVFIFELILSTEKFQVWIKSLLEINSSLEKWSYQKCKREGNSKMHGVQKDAAKCGWICKFSLNRKWKVLRTENFSRQREIANSSGSNREFGGAGNESDSSQRQLWIQLTPWRILCRRTRISNLNTRECCLRVLEISEQSEAKFAKRSFASNTCTDEINDSGG